MHVAVVGEVIIVPRDGAVRIGVRPRYLAAAPVGCRSDDVGGNVMVVPLSLLSDVSYVTARYEGRSRLGECRELG